MRKLLHMSRRLFFHLISRHNHKQSEIVTAREIGIETEQSRNTVSWFELAESVADPQSGFSQQLMTHSSFYIFARIRSLSDFPSECFSFIQFHFIQLSFATPRAALLFAFHSQKKKQNSRCRRELFL